MTSIREKFIGTVSSTDDPEQRGRIKVLCASLTGTEDEALPMWVPPMADWGWFYVPNVGELVELEGVTADSDDEARGAVSISQMDLCWKGRYWGNSQGAAPTPVPDDFKGENYGKRRGFATPAGHVLMFDDTEGARKVSLVLKVKDVSEDGSSPAEYCYFSLDNGNIILANKKGSLLHLDSENETLSLIDQHGNSYSSGAGGIAIVDKGGNFISCDGSGAINIISQGTVNLQCKNAVIDAGKIELTAGATDAMLKSSIFSTIFASHTHTCASPGSPTSPPLPPNNVLTPAMSTRCFNG